jgi:hypothetical protein
VYWVSAYEILEDRGIEVIVANARDAKAVPGRKTDVNDAQWLQRLHACGLLRASFRPGRDIAALRAYLRLRERHLDYAAAHIQHMQKALTFMNLQLHHVVSDVTGVTGMKIIRAIVNGQRDPKVLAQMRDVRCKASIETVHAALIGNYQPEHVFALQQALELYDFYQAQWLIACQDQEVLTVLAAGKTAPGAPIPKARHHSCRQRHEFRCSTCPLPACRCGSDADSWARAVPGATSDWRMRYRPESMEDRQALHLLVDAVSRVEDQRRQGAVRTHAKDDQPRGGASSAGRSHRRRTNTALGAFYRRLSARIGKAKAVTATARKIAILFYNAMRFGLDYQDPGASHTNRNTGSA